MGEIVSFGNDKISVLMNTEQLWLHAQNLYKNKPVNILKWAWEGHMNPILSD